MLRFSLCFLGAVILAGCGDTPLPDRDGGGAGEDLAGPRDGQFSDLRLIVGDGSASETATTPTYRWVTGPWSPCSVTCGPGQKAREVFCLDELSNLQVDDANCPPPKPPTLEGCNGGACPDCSAIASAAGHVGQWLVCSAFDPVAQQCEGLFLDGAGCVAFCAAAGLKCKEKYGAGDTCQSKEALELTCGVDSGHQTDWCVCGP